MQAGLAQSRLPDGSLLAGSQPVAVDGSRAGEKPRIFWRRERAPASMAAQSQPPGAPALLEAPQVQSLPVPSGPPLATVVGAPDTSGPCDFWIVSSRDCNGKIAPRDAACCLSYFHRTSDQCLVPKGRDAFLASIRPDRPVCFVIHGSYNYWHDIVSESQKINRWIHCAAPGYPIQFVYFTWPSDGYMPFIFPVDLAILGRRSAAHGAYLASLITQLPPDQPVSIVGHSHGARTAVAAMHVLGGGVLENCQGLPPGFAAPQHLRAVLIAAAIDHHWMNPGQRYGQSLLCPERVLLLRNGCDVTLGIYPLRIGSGERALGKYGLGPDDRWALGPLGMKVAEFDVAQYTSWHHSFDNYHERPELGAALVPYIYFHDDAPATMGPVTGPPPFSSPSTAAPAAMTMQGSTASSPTVTRKAKTPELWVDDSSSPASRRQPVELRFEH